MFCLRYIDHLHSHFQLHTKSDQENIPSKLSVFENLNTNMTSSNNEDFYSYKARKEAFVSNLKGTTRLEIVIIGILFLFVSFGFIH